MLLTSDDLSEIRSSFENGTEKNGTISFSGDWSFGR
jgi:hypothetical protein